MRSIISGAIGLLWGGALLVVGAINGDAIQLVIGAVLFAAGSYYMRKGLAERRAASPPAA